MAQNPPSNEKLAAQLGQLTTIVANLATAVNNLAGAGAANPAPAAAAAFALTPGLAAGNNLIDFSTKNGLALYKAGIEPLPTPFDLKAEQVVVFENELANKVARWAGTKASRTSPLTSTKMALQSISSPSRVKFTTRPSRLPAKSLSRKQEQGVSNARHKTMNKCGFVSTTPSPNKPRLRCYLTARTTTSKTMGPRKLLPLSSTRPSCVWPLSTPMPPIGNCTPIYVSLRVMQLEKTATSTRYTPILTKTTLSSAPADRQWMMSTPSSLMPTWPSPMLSSTNT